MRRAAKFAPIAFGIMAIALVAILMALQPTTTSAGFSGPTTTGTPIHGAIHTYVDPTQGSGTTTPPTDSQSPPDRSDGFLQVIKNGKAGEFCPLKHTDMNAEISGFLSRVTVTQEFVNPSQENIEAIYVFPLPNNAAVDDMTLHVGNRTIKGLIKPREEAQKIYQQARNTGHTAALLDQERPNIFTQSVANIGAGMIVKVEISYSETLKYEAGSYEFVYPMVVGPRYIPGQPTGKQGGGWAHDTAQVPDASRNAPPVAGVHYGKQDSRAGHDISLTVSIDAGVTIQQLKSELHEVDIQHNNTHAATVRLRNQNEIPNRDFVLKYDVAGGKIEDALLVHSRPATQHETKGGGVESSPNDGFFSFILQPPDRVRNEDATPREIIFVLDTSGSMSGFPIETAKKTLKKMLDSARPMDTFNVITFSGDEHILFPQPVPASANNISQAQQFLAGQRGRGGTEMMKAIRAALGDDAAHGFNNPTQEKCGPMKDCAVRPLEESSARPVRIVCFMTDGYVGNDMEIIGAVQKHPEARVFSFGIGTAVNRFLLDGMARAGRGEVEYVTRSEDAEPAADRFYERVHTPVLTDISIDLGNLPVHDVMPSKPLDLFTAKPLVISGRYSGAAQGVIRLKGLRAGQPFTREIKVNLPADESKNQALAQLWARKRIDELMSEDWEGMQQGIPRKDLREQITQLGLDYRLMTQFTSFVAVEEQTVVEGGQPRTIQVPVEMPQGVSPEGVFGQRVDRTALFSRGVVNTMTVSPSAMEVVEVEASKSLRDQSTSEFLYGMANHNSSGQAAPIFDSKARADQRAKKEADRIEKDKQSVKLLASKLNPSLLAAFECWLQQRTNKTANCSDIHKGKVNVQIMLATDAGSALKQLQVLGFVSGSAPLNIIGANPKMIFGTVPMEKLEALAQSPLVQLIALQK